MDTTSRSHFGFIDKVRETFLFLNELGFSEVEAQPTLVRYRKGEIEVDIYHGHQSYEIGAGITAFGARYSISEIIRATSPKTAERFHYPMVTSPEGVTSGLEKLSLLMRRYSDDALRGSSLFFSMLEKKRKRWSDEYALDVLAEQLMPQANNAFRQKDYSIAANLYSRIQERLSPVEIRKLRFAEKH
uniref:Uncharacterized protein n=1 Tax=Candidatus Kentrum sp. LPFa TaxID=2126335 RepID=A0A450WZU3_9GAMM|nr:MAG: hypothetical protein BECKLPF1236B_GA0070989_13143 [Candidatus Kentron sp. LPFa]